MTEMHYHIIIVYKISKEAERERERERMTITREKGTIRLSIRLWLKCATKMCSVTSVQLIVGLSPGLVESTLANVSDPLYNIMIAVVQLGLKHLQIPNFQTRTCKGHL